MIKLPLISLGPELTLSVCSSKGGSNKNDWLILLRSEGRVIKVPAPCFLETVNLEKKKLEFRCFFSCSLVNGLTFDPQPRIDKKHHLIQYLSIIGDTEAIWIMESSDNRMNFGGLGRYREASKETCFGQKVTFHTEGASWYL